MIVDDEPFNLIVFEGILKKLQQPYETAGSGQQALDKIKDRTEAFKRGETNVQYKLIFLDYSMPIMDGPTFAFELRKYLDEQ